MKRHVGDFVRRCLTCQQIKAEHQKPAGRLQPLEVAERTIQVLEDMLRACVLDHKGS